VTSPFGYERKSRPIGSTSALPAIADLKEPMSVFGLLMTALATEADIAAPAADFR
jgi:hypothetical protein